MVNKINNILRLKKLKIECLVSVSPSKKINIVNENASDKIKRLSRSIGISSKYVCDKDQRFSTLAETGINFLINKLKLKKNEIDGIVVVTQSPDYIMPGTAVLLQDRCGLPINTLAYDINLGCSGYPYGLFVGHGHLLSGMKRVLLVVGDQSFSPGTKDEGHGVLFGDACTVTSLVLDDEINDSVFSCGTDGSGLKALYIPHGGKVRPVTEDSLVPKLDETGVMRTGTDVVLDGPKIHNFSVGLVENELRKLCDFVNVNLDEIDYFVLHQANKLINNTIRMKMKKEIEKFPESLSDFGNTSSASIPITMTARLNDSWILKDKKILMCGFGIGLSWSSFLYTSKGDEMSFHIFD